MTLPTNIPALLRESDPEADESLRGRSDRRREESVGEQVHLRGLVEISNHCRRRCLYCGLRCENTAVARYRMTADEILEAARLAERLGYGTVVLQAGEDEALTAERIAEVIALLCEATPLAVTLSLGEREESELRLWREAGADRYLLRFETSRRELYERIHPPHGNRRSDRVELLGTLRELGYETGTGMMVGIPGQTYDDLAADIALLEELQPDMIGLGPFVPDAATPLGRPNFPPSRDQAPATVELALKAIALARLACPEANIPATTALATLDGPAAWAEGLRWGANVLMPNLTPRRYRELYAIYPAKAGSKFEPDQSHRATTEVLATLGRPAGRGRGDSPHYLRNVAAIS